MMDFPGGAVVKIPPANCRRRKRNGFDPWTGKMPWKRKWQHTPVFLPEKSHGQRSLAGSSWGHEESDTTDKRSVHTHTHTHTFTVVSSELQLYQGFQWFCFCPVCLSSFSGMTSLRRRDVGPLVPDVLSFCCVTS